MAQLGNLIVTGVSRLLSKLYVSDSVTAPTFIGKLQGNADSATKWGSLENDTGTTNSSGSSILIKNQNKVQIRAASDFALSTDTLVFTNISVETSAFVSDTTYTDYPYKVSLTCNGVTDKYIPTVNLASTQATTGNFSPVSLSGTNAVTIYAKEKEIAAFTIPSIVCVKGGV